MGDAAMSECLKHVRPCHLCVARAVQQERNEGQVRLADAVARAVEGAKAEGYSRGYQEGLTRGAAEAVEGERERIIALLLLEWAR
jgi:flagellar biosynthesis/type III secretory pathway protein FliH